MPRASLIPLALMTPTDINELEVATTQGMPQIFWDLTRAALVAGLLPPLTHPFDTRNVLKICGKPIPSFKELYRNFPKIWAMNGMGRFLSWGAFYTLYGRLSNTLAPHLPPGVSSKMAAAFIATTAGELFTAPFAKVALRLRIDPQAQAIVPTLRHIIQQEGALAFWHGCKPPILSQGIYNALFFPCGERLQKWLEDGMGNFPHKQFVASVTAGWLAALAFSPITYPIHRTVVAMRIQKPGTDNPPRSFMATFKGIAQQGYATNKMRGLCREVFRGLGEALLRTPITGIAMMGIGTLIKNLSS